MRSAASPARLAILAALAVGVAAAPGSGVAQTASAPTSTKDTLIVAGAVNQGTLDPHFAITTQEVLFTRNIHNALVKFKPNTIELEPDLATAWTVSKDGLEYTFKLRRDVEWQKGYGHFTAADVKASFDRLLDPATKSPFAGSLRMLKEAQVVDDYTVKLLLKEPYAGLLYLLTPYRAGPIVNARAAREKGAGFAWDPVGTGPYVFESRIPNREAVMRANEKYFGGAPPIKKVVFKTVTDVNAEVLGLENGEYDLIYTQIREQAVVDRLKRSGFKEALVRRNLPQVLMMNVTVKPFDSLKVRQAIAHAVDRQQLIDLAYSGVGEPWFSPIPKGYPYVTESVPRYDHDLPKARQLLAEAGYPQGLEVTMVNYDENKLGGEVLAEQLKPAGITVKLEVLDQPTWLGRLFRNQGIHFAIHCCVRQPDPDIWLSDAFTPTGGALGITKYNLEADLIPARRELDPKKREQLYVEIQRKLMRDLPMIPLMMRPESMVHSSKLQGMPTLEPIWGLDATRLTFN
jgi:peptide/nickel transport system substrate-binding protein